MIPPHAVLTALEAHRLAVASSLAAWLAYNRDTQARDAAAAGVSGAAYERAHALRARTLIEVDLAVREWCVNEGGRRVA
jgi:hypothetical protein